MNSRAKGARGERQWRDELRANGYTARRGQQFSGSPDSPDVVCDELAWAHFEVKAVERLNIYDSMEQARRDCALKSHLTPTLSPNGGEGEIAIVPKLPLVAHKRNHRRWLVTMDADTFFRPLRGEFETSPSLRQPSPVPSGHPLPSDGRGASATGGEGEDFPRGTLPPESANQTNSKPKKEPTT